jgi:hypothetical protein
LVVDELAAVVAIDAEHGKRQVFPREGNLFLDPAMSD